MPKRRLTFVFSNLIVIILILSLISPFMEGFSDISNTVNLSSARAESLEISSIYIPFATIRYPVENIFGVGLNSISTTGGLDALAQTSSSWVRKDGVRWNMVETVKGERNWDVLNDLNTQLLAARRANQRVVMVVQGTPGWAAIDSHTTCGPIKPEELGSFASFMYDLVARYSGYPYYVKNWEIWNEPDTDALDSVEGFGCWGDASDEYYGGRYFAQMLASIYPAIKSADPQSRVIVGGLLLDCRPDICVSQGKPENPPKFLEGILEAGGGSYFDGISFHAYDYYSNGSYGNANWGTSKSTGGPVSSAKASFVRALLNQYGVSGKFLMNTESALICPGTCDTNFELVKANYVIQTFAVAAAQNFEANLWYNMLGWRQSGLLDSNLNTLDAYRAFKFASEKLGGAIYTSNISSNNLEIYEFRKGNRRILVLWSKDGNIYPHNLTPIRMYDAFGISISNISSVGPSPVYIELNL